MQDVMGNITSLEFIWYMFCCCKCHYNHHWFQFVANIMKIIRTPPLNFSKIRLFYMIFSKYLLVFLITSFMEKRMRGSYKSWHTIRWESISAKKVYLSNLTMRIYKVSWCASLSFKEALLHLSKNFIKLAFIFSVPDPLLFFPVHGKILVWAGRKNYPSR